MDTESSSLIGNRIKVLTLNKIVKDVMNSECDESKKQESSHNSMRQEVMLSLNRSEKSDFVITDQT